MTLRDSHYRAKQPHRGRGLADLDRLVGGVGDDIERFLAQHRPVRVLELGCGYGTALLELAARHGEAVELHGLNRERIDGDVATLERNASERGLVVPARAFPRLHYADVAHGLPLPDDAFDLVFSQVAWLYFGDKLAVLREVARVLAPQGIAKIDADELRSALPAEHARLVEIWDGGRLLSFADYLARHGARLARAPEGTYVSMSKSRTIGSDVELVAEIDTSRLHPDWDGVRCIYRLR